jgi:hypothetical protein
VAVGFVSKWFLISGVVESWSLPDGHFDEVFTLVVIALSTLLNAGYFLPIVYRAFFKPLADNDLGVNPTKGKKLDNMRASGKDETIALVPPIRFTLEQALEFVQEDELCEVTPKSIRLRKKILGDSERTRAAKKSS